MFILRKWVIGIVISFLFFQLHANEEQQWVSGIIRVNTDVSAGWESFSDVAQNAENAGLGFVVFSDQFVVKAEYGFFPFRNSLKFTRTRPSVLSYGIENYLQGIKSVDLESPNVILIPGADIAPHYYWQGRPFGKDFSCRQYSEQLTVIGPANPEFYRHLPVIHNDKSRFNLISVIKLLPLILCLWGIVLIWFRNVGGYSDEQGNKYPHKSKRLRALFGILLIILGILWTVENCPFSQTSTYNQYSDFGVKPYQDTLDYIRKNSKEGKCGVFWSAPEATMNDKIFGVRLTTLPYLDDVLATTGHNGFAGMYGDALTAQKSGHEWDQLLMEYIQGKRKIRPVIIGESDYHGKKRKIDHIQTIVAVEEPNSENIVKAICKGNSYAYSKSQLNEIKVGQVSLVNEKGSASLGETLAYKGNFSPALKLTGKILGINAKSTLLDLTVICNGKAIYFKRFTGENFDLNIPLIIHAEEQHRGYIRIILETNKAGNIFTNPIFYESVSAER